MKKFWEILMRTETQSPSQQKKVKSVILQSYFTSLLSLILCVSMFVGTSYAWFTSEIENTGNEIYVGILRVELTKQVDEQWVPLSNVSDATADVPRLFDGSFIWEPGCTKLETIKVKNTGELNFKYVLSFTEGELIEKQNDGTATVSEDEGENQEELTLASVAKYFEVKVFDHSGDISYEEPSSYELMTKDKGWSEPINLADLLAGTVVLEDQLCITDSSIDLTENKTAEAQSTENQTAKTYPSATYTIALHMKEDATSDIMGKKISLNVKLVAYQMPSETGDLGGTYDGDLELVFSAEKLQESLNATEKKNIVLASNITLADAEDVLTMDGGSLDGNGNTITYTGGRNTNDNSVGVLSTTGGKISNLTITGTEDENGKLNGRALYVTELESDLVVSGCTFEGAYAFNINSNVGNQEVTLSFTDTVFKSWTSYANVMKHAYFTGCTFENVLRPYGDTTLVNCDFGTDGKLDTSKLENGEIIKLVNCTYNGRPIENAEVYSGQTIVLKEGRELLTIDKDTGMLVLKNEG